ncbi:MAG: integrase/recombinase XerC, partial [Flavobacterium sp.]
MATTTDAFTDYLQKEKKYSPHTINAYLKDMANFQSFNKIHFHQDNVEQVNYSQIRTWI